MRKYNLFLNSVKLNNLRKLFFLLSQFKFISWLLLYILNTYVKYFHKRIYWITKFILYTNIFLKYLIHCKRNAYFYLLVINDASLCILLLLLSMRCVFLYVLFNSFLFTHVCRFDDGVYIMYYCKFFKTWIFFTVKQK